MLICYLEGKGNGLFWDSDPLPSLPLQEHSNNISSGDASQEGEASHPAIATARKRAPTLPVSAPGRTAFSGPTTNVNIGVDIWNPPHTGPAPLKVRPNARIAAAAGANVLMIDNQRAQLLPGIHGPIFTFMLSHELFIILFSHPYVFAPCSMIGN